MASAASGTDYIPATNGASDRSGIRYEQKLVTEMEWIQNNVTGDIPGAIKRYLVSLFPILSWIYRYNLTWALGGNLSQ